MKSPFLDKEKIIENQLSFSIYDGFPVSKGHALILPKRIVADIFDLNDDEYNSCFELVKKVRTILLKKLTLMKKKDALQNLLANTFQKLKIN